MTVLNLLIDWRRH